jgi:hypothetical protein
LRKIAQLVFPTKQIPTSFADIFLSFTTVLRIEFPIEKDPATIGSITKVCDLNLMLTITLQHFNGCQVFPVIFHGSIMV